MGIVSLAFSVLSLVTLGVALMLNQDVLLYISLTLAAAGLFTGLNALVNHKQRSEALAGVVCASLGAIVVAITLGISHGVID